MPSPITAFPPRARAVSRLRKPPFSVSPRRRLELAAEFVEVETGKGSDALDRRPQLAAALAGGRSRKCPSLSRSSTASRAMSRSLPASWRNGCRSSLPNAALPPSSEGVFSGFSASVRACRAQNRCWKTESKGPSRQRGGGHCARGKSCRWPHHCRHRPEQWCWLRKRGAALRLWRL